MASVTPSIANPTTVPEPRSWIERLWSSVADRGRSYAEVLQPQASKAPLDRARELASALLSERGEASGAAVARAQDGLRGVSFGNFLIKQVVEELKVELPRVMHFSTLSPVPGFSRWLKKRLAAGEAAEAVA